MKALRCSVMHISAAPRASVLLMSIGVWIRMSSVSMSMTLITREQRSHFDILQLPQNGFSNVQRGTVDMTRHARKVFAWLPNMLLKAASTSALNGRSAVPERMNFRQQFFGNSPDMKNFDSVPHRPLTKPIQTDMAQQLEETSHKLVANSNTTDTNSPSELPHDMRNSTSLKSVQALKITIHVKEGASVATSQASDEKDDNKNFTLMPRLRFG